MYQGAAIAAAAAWLATFAACVAFSRPNSRSITTRRGQRPAQQLANQPPALVNLVVSDGKLTAAAYSDTIRDLVARGHLEVIEREQGDLWCQLPASPASPAGLAEFERRALGDATGMLSQTDGAPFEAVSGACWVDPRGRWDPFERAVRDEARRRGLIGSRIPATWRAALQAAAVGVASLAYLAVHSRPHAGFWAPLTAGLIALAVLSYLLQTAARKCRLSRTGTALAGRADSQGPVLLTSLNSQPGRPGTAAPGTAGPESPDLVPLPRSPVPVPAQLITAAEAAQAFGQPVRISGFAGPDGGGVIYRASGAILILTVTDGFIARIAARSGRRSGKALPGVGDRAWLVSRDRTAVVQVGTYTVKITLSAGEVSGGYAGLLTTLAQVVAARLADHHAAESSRPPAG